MDPSDHRRVAEALANMSDRFGVVKPDADGHERDPADLMVLLARELRYRGRWLSPEELARLKRASGRDRELALLWDARVRRFQDDRPLPPGFARGPLRWQLETLAWSFHLDDDPNAPRRNTGEIPHALAEALAVDVPLRPNPLEARYPALTDYRRFLGRLPRR